MQQACVGVTAEYVVDTHHQEETVRVPLLGIYLIEDGKVRVLNIKRMPSSDCGFQLKEGTNVMDVSVFKAEGPEVSCLIM